MRKAERFAGEELKEGRHKGVRCGTLWMQPEFGEGDVTLTLEFVEDDPILRLDVLGDVIGLLEREYDAALAAMRLKYGKREKRDAA